MINKKPLLQVLIAAIIITTLFHKQALGLNLLVFEIIFIVWLLITKQFKSSSFSQIICGLGLITSLIFSVITYSVFGYIIHFISLILFIGSLIYPEVKSLIHAFVLGLNSLLHAQIQFFEKLGGQEKKGTKPIRIFRNLSIFLVPIVLIIVFIFIYKASNPVFEKMITKVGEAISDAWIYVFQDFDFLILLTFLIGLLISSFLLIRIKNKWIAEKDKNSSDKLLRTRTKKVIHFRMNALKNEYKAAIFLLFALNILILLLNCMDVYWVWLNFEYEGQYLKQFVHEGTYLLILSIIISMGIVLFFFRANLNFYSRNKFLTYLSYIWLAQNAFLVISVAIRNFIYISHFALAYKRIGVFIFLILTLFGLLTVILKVKKKKSTFYLFRTNSLALLIILLISSSINWDVIIAKYNFKKSTESFLHLDYMATLSDKALPYLDKTLEELNQLNMIQKEKYNFRARYMTPEEYVAAIEKRQTEFITKWENKSILSWNYAEYLAYKKLKTE